MHESQMRPGFTVRVRVRAKDRNRCPYCLKGCPRYDAGHGPRRWRTHAIGQVRTTVEADGYRVQCTSHGVHVAYVPWARHRAGFTRSFEDEVSWFCVRTDKTTVCKMFGIAWRTVGAILERVGGARARSPARLDGVRRIGIDEVSYRKGHRYLVAVVDHDTGRLLWAHPGRDAKTLSKFGSPDMSVGHVSLGSCGQRPRWVLLKNPDRLSGKQRRRLADIKRANQPLYAAYLLKEQLREVFQNRDWQGALMLCEWAHMAKRSRIAAFKRVAETIEKNMAGIQSALLHRLSNARLESLNTKLKLLTRTAYGFHGPKPLIALAMLKYGGLCPQLPSLASPTLMSGEPDFPSS